MNDFAQYKAQVRALFNPIAVQAAKDHARREFPKESCGLIVDGEYIACFNYALTPETDFKIAPDVWTNLVSSGRTIEAVVHSHPNGPMYPSENDMAGQIATDVPWMIITLNEDEISDDVIVWGDDLPDAPLLERPFVWGVFDCYTLVRDYYKQKHGLTLPAVAREDGYWKRGQDLYGDYLKKMGFQKIAREEARPGDGFLIAIESPVPNHAGILIEDSLILHHLPNRLSRREPAGLWARGADVWVRHPELNQDEA